MALTRRQIITIFSIIYLFALTVVASYSMHTIGTHSLPISTPLGAFTVALPAITGLSIESVLGLIRQRPPRHTFTGFTLASIYPQIVVFFLTIYETVLATLLGTHLSPIGGLSCGLHQQWQSLYHNHRAKSIKKIQDAFNCCGLNTVYDMAWPFPDKDHKQSPCSTRYGRSKSCFKDWRGEERTMAGLLLLVVVFVFVWKMLVVLWSRRVGTGAAWFSGGRIAEVSEEDEGRPAGSRRAIAYDRVVEGERYLDEPERRERERDVEAPEPVDERTENIGHAMAPSGLGAGGQEWSRD